MDHRMSFTVLPAEARRRLGRLRQMAAAAEAPGTDGLREALVTLALALYRQVIAGGAARLDTRELLVQRALEIVRQASGQPLTLAAVAQSVHVSPNYLTSLFRQVAGKSLGRVILEERMVRAEGLLRQPDLSIKEIAARLGFSDTYTFSRAFKTHSGRSPTAWRSGV
jgi:AraC-like DNA-binding protein